MPGDNWGETGVSLLPIRKAPYFETMLTHIGAFSNCLHLRWQTLYSLLQATRGGVEKTMKWLIFLFCMLGFGCNWAGDPQHLPAETIDVNGLSRTTIFCPSETTGMMPLLIAATVVVLARSFRRRVSLRRSPQKASSLRCRRAKSLLAMKAMVAKHHPERGGHQFHQCAHR